MMFKKEGRRFTPMTQISDDRDIGVMCVPISRRGKAAVVVE